MVMTGPYSRRRSPISRTASMECPPRETKSLTALTSSSRSSASAKNSQTVLSVPLSGPRSPAVVSAPSGLASGSALVSAFPFTVSGMLSTWAKCVGRRKSGSPAPASPATCARSAESARTR